MGPVVKVSTCQESRCKQQLSILDKEFEGTDFARSGCPNIKDIFKRGQSQALSLCSLFPTREELLAQSHTYWDETNALKVVIAA